MAVTDGLCRSWQGLLLLSRGPEVLPFTSILGASALFIPRIAAEQFPGPLVAETIIAVVLFCVDFFMCRSRCL
jgi:hypothetical protein